MASQSNKRIPIKFVDGLKAIYVLWNSDPYLHQMTPLDRQIRTDKVGTDEHISVEEFSIYLAQQVLPWSPEEIEAVTKAFLELEPKLEKYDLIYPECIRLIKTNGLDDVRGCSGYCRRNAITMSQKVVTNIMTNHEDDDFFPHEMFHIASQNDPAKRYKLYEQIGFFHCREEIELPKQLLDIKITNPDAPRLDVFINVTYNGQVVSAMPLIFYNKDGPDSFFKRLYIKLIIITFDETVGKHVCLLDNDDNPTLFSVEDVPDFFTQTGESNYFFHPEEILATRFADMILFPDKKDKFTEMICDVLLPSNGDASCTP